FGPWSLGVSVNNDTQNLAAPYILYGGGAWDFGLPNPAQVEARTNAVVENVVVAGGHDFNAWNQLFAIFASDYLWKPEAFLGGEIDELKDGVANANLNRGLRTALTVKLDQAYRQIERGNEDG